jgi:NitT/TauT family transport system substrate-binding protein
MSFSKPIQANFIVPLCLFALLSLAAPTHEARADETIKLRLDFFTAAIHSPYFLAVERGWYKKAGLDVTIEDGSGSINTTQLVDAGNFDLGEVSLGAMAVGRAKGLNVISIASYLRQGSIGILVKQSLGVKSLKDLEGKKVLYTAASMEGPFIERLFPDNGVPIDKVNLLNVDGPSKIGMYLAGQTDGVVTDIPGMMSIAIGQVPSDALPFSDYGLYIPSFGMIARTDTLKTKSAAIKAFNSISCASWKYIMDGHDDEAVNATMAQRPNSPSKPAALHEQLVQYRKFLTTPATKDMPTCFQSDADWENAIKGMEHATVIPAGTKPSLYFTNEYIDLDYAKSIL